MADRWLAGRVLVGGSALALVVGASGKGCDNDKSFFSERSQCPDPVEVVFGSAGAATVLARGELANDMEAARRIAQAVAEFEDGTLRGGIVEEGLQGDRAAR